METAIQTGRLGKSYRSNPDFSKTIIQELKLSRSFHNLLDRNKENTGDVKFPFKCDKKQKTHLKLYLDSRPKTIKLEEKVL